MAYGKQTEKNKPTLKDFEEQTSPQEKKLWNEYLKTYPEPFKRSALPGFDGFLFFCPLPDWWWSWRNLNSLGTPAAARWGKRATPSGI